MRTSLIAAAFDFHAGQLSPDSELGGAEAGVTRFVLAGGDKAPLEVGNLTTPITFTIPSPDASQPGRKAACAFWSDATRSYETAGCAALPNPVPRGLKVEWLPRLEAASDAAMGALWAASGPGMCVYDPGNPAANDNCCNVTRLRCDDPGARAYPDTKQPLAVPPVSCPPSAAPGTTLAVFSGPRCPLVDPAKGCSWNATLQAFTGAGCVASNVTSCACRCASACGMAFSPHAAAAVKHIPASCWNTEH